MPDRKTTKSEKFKSFKLSAVMLAVPAMMPLNQGCALWSLGGVLWETFPGGKS